MDKLPQTAQRRVKRALAAAWTDPNPTRAEQCLRRLADDLQQEGYGEAAASLREGLEDTLTHLRLQVPAALARSLRSTNAMENYVAMLHLACAWHAYRAAASCCACRRWR
jgi:putative transposase